MRSQKEVSDMDSERFKIGLKFELLMALNVNNKLKVNILNVGSFLLRKVQPARENVFLIKPIIYVINLWGNFSWFSFVV